MDTKLNKKVVLSIDNNLFEKIKIISNEIYESNSGVMRKALLSYIKEFEANKNKMQGVIQ